jgi:hypothetical protein
MGNLAAEERGRPQNSAPPRPQPSIDRPMGVLLGRSARTLDVPSNDVENDLALRIGKIQRVEDASQIINQPLRV